MTTALTTLASVKAKLAITDTGSDTLLQTYVTAACQNAESWLGRVLGTAPYTLNFNGNGRSSKFLGQYPVTAVASVTIDGTAIPACQTQIDNGYVFDNYSVYLRGYLFNKGAQNCQIEYTAGYTSNAIPPDISDAVDEIVILNYQRRGHIDTSSKSLAGETVSYIQLDMPTSAKAKLQNYKLVAPIL